MDYTSTPRPRRNLELGLLIMAWILGIGAYWSVDMVMLDTLSPDFAVRQAVFVALPLIFHVVLRVRAKYADPYILPIATLLNGLGLAMIHRLDLPFDGRDDAGRQLTWMAVSVVAAIALVVVLKDARRLQKFTYICLFASLVLLALPLLPEPIGVPINGARLWINVGFGTFQPGEVAKITLAIFFAGYLSTNRDLILLAGRRVGPLQFPRFRDMWPMLAAWFISIGVLLTQNDLGSSILFFGLFMAMIYIATGRISWIVIGLGLVAVGAVLAYTFFSHVTRRINAWLYAFQPEFYNAQGGSQQIVQGLFGFANGGLFGKGLGQGRPDIVTYANSDMILTAFGEELGLIGTMAIVMLVVLLVTRGMRAALGTKDGFGKLLAAGLSFVVALQFFTIAGGVTRLLPLTGLTTPFMAAGGSSLLANWLIVALLLLISENARRPLITGPMTDEDRDARRKRRFWPSSQDQEADAA
ncbi:FtsW/RodA/SpoVE family cell cycle protein [Falsarthrobacter nasiphocae]|uniref:Cell division protein FtsW (Lipid II flippase) n=1 Tax=Falsarthrobacter nasiphocae TaxID=189863 RepID=A0AAE4C6D5_9MICC|nr:FtsW/RodA/SpoVE family cell cycle protein [Falsarthrobacter nasiphocae]MDR6892042.1 cell division protein FtsW (lipid II flippase) [Falsarthrobacter nasiphocae]